MGSSCCRCRRLQSVRRRSHHYQPLFILVDEKAHQAAPNDNAVVGLQQLLELAAVSVVHVTSVNCKGQPILTSQVPRLAELISQMHMLTTVTFEGCALTPPVLAEFYQALLPHADHTASFNIRCNVIGGEGLALYIKNLHQFPLINSLQFDYVGLNKFNISKLLQEISVTDFEVLARIKSISLGLNTLNGCSEELMVILASFFFSAID